jgi:hypothetical protein
LPQASITVAGYSLRMMRGWGVGTQHGALAKQKVREQILTLPSETLICRGHEPLTTVAEEQANNPFFG